MVNLFSLNVDKTVKVSEDASKTDNTPNMSSSTLIHAELVEPNGVGIEKDNEQVVLVGQVLDNTHESKLEPSAEAYY